MKKLFSLLLVTIFFQYAICHAENQIYGIIKYPIKIFEKPSLNSPAVSKANKGDRFILLEKSDSWFKILTPKKTIGWVASNWLIPTGDISKLKDNSDAKPLSIAEDLEILNEVFDPPIHGKPELTIRGWSGVRLIVTW